MAVIPAIQLTEHKGYWKDWYLDEQTFLLSFLPKTIRMNHIGSTAIKEIWAKPIVDILVEAPLKDHQTIKDLLLKNSYLCMAQDETRMDFNKGYTPDGFAERVFHLHLREFGDHDELYFRDYMNENPEFVRKYTQKAIEQYGKEKYK